MSRVFVPYFRIQSSSC